MHNPYLYLGIAIVAEVIATSLLKSSAGFTRLWPSIATGIAYAIWAGVGIVLISLVGWLVFDQVLDTPALVGMGLIVSGVAVINLFSKTAVH